MTQENDINTHIVLVTAFIEKEGKILLSKRSKNDPQAGGLWSIPGGKVDMDKGENIIELTLKREIKEEVDLTISNKIEYLGSYGFTRISGHHVVGLIFLAHYLSGVAKPLEDQEEVAWYSLRDLTKLDNLPEFLISQIKLLKHHIEG